MSTHGMVLTLAAWLTAWTVAPASQTPAPATDPPTRDPRVTLVYFEPATQSAVTLAGTARLVRDPAEKARHWKDEWQTFYQNTHKGDDYVLIRVTPSRLEVVGEAYGMVNDPATWRPVILPLP